jgi:hypothetical protein
MSNDHNDNDLPKQPEIVPQDGCIPVRFNPDFSAQVRLDRGAEPFWMQDVRIAQRRIEAQRVSLRPAPSDDPVDLP